MHLAIVLLFIFSISSVDVRSLRSIGRLVSPVSNHATVVLRVKRAMEENDGHRNLKDMARSLSQERKNRRLLRKKKKRLRELREEIRAMNRIVEKDAQMEEMSELPSSKRKNSASEKWRKKVLSKMRAIMQRLDRLERQWTGGDKIIPETTSKVRTVHTMRPTMKEKKVHKHLLSMTAMNGENGTSCASHKDCRPGRCCHRVPSGSGGTCLFHGLTLTTPCMDSCQCESQLHCFAPKDNSTASMCKRATSTDIRTGYYVNVPDSLFSSSFSSTMTPSTQSHPPSFSSSREKRSSV